MYVLHTVYGFQTQSEKHNEHTCRSKSKHKMFLKHEKLMFVTFTLILLQSYENHLLTLESQVTGSSQLNSSIFWPTWSNTSLPLKLKELSSFKDLIGQKLIQSSNTMMENLRRAFPDKEIPLFNMVCQIGFSVVFFSVTEAFRWHIPLFSILSFKWEYSISSNLLVHTRQY